MNITFILADGQLEEIARRVADILREQSATPETPTDDRELLRVADAAKLSGLSPKTLYNYLSEGRLARHGQPRAPMVSRAELLALMGTDVPTRLAWI